MTIACLNIAEIHETDQNVQGKSLPSCSAFGMDKFPNHKADSSLPQFIIRANSRKKVRFTAEDKARQKYTFIALVHNFSLWVCTKRFCLWMTAENVVYFRQLKESWANGRSHACGCVGIVHIVCIRVLSVFTLKIFQNCPSKVCMRIK